MQNTEAWHGTQAFSERYPLLTDAGVYGEPGPCTDFGMCGTMPKACTERISRTFPAVTSAHEARCPRCAGCLVIASWHASLTSSPYTWPERIAMKRQSKPDMCRALSKHPLHCESSRNGPYQASLDKDFGI